MTKAVTYRGQYARIDFDPDDLILTGRLAGIEDIVTFHAETPAGIIQAFRDAVDGYLEACRRVGKEPQRPYSGRLYVRVDPEQHARYVRAAELAGMSFNQWGEEAMNQAAAEIFDGAVPV